MSHDKNALNSRGERVEVCQTLRDKIHISKRAAETLTESAAASVVRLFNRIPCNHISGQLDITRHQFLKQRGFENAV